jgi:hypothetical protein
MTIARGPHGADREAVMSEAAWQELTLDDIESKKLPDYNQKSMMNYVTSTPGRFTQILLLLGGFNSPRDHYKIPVKAPNTSLTSDSIGETLVILKGSPSQ